MNLDGTKQKLLDWWGANASHSTKIQNWLQKYKMPIFVATGVVLFFNLAPKPKTTNIVVTALLEWWYVGPIVIGVILFVKILTYLYKSGTFSWWSTKTDVPPRTLNPVAATSIARVSVQRTNNSALWAIFFLLLVCMVGVVWFYVLPKYPDIKTSEVFEKVSQHKDFLKGCWWYGIAILAGLFSYFFGGMRTYKRPFAALLVAVAVAGCVYLYLHPEVLKTIINSFIDKDPNRPIISTEMGRILLILIILTLLMTGNILTLLLFAIVLFFYYSYTCFGI